jgi:hypothetical protein
MPIPALGDKPEITLPSPNPHALLTKFGTCLAFTSNVQKLPTFLYRHLNVGMQTFAPYVYEAEITLPCNSLTLTSYILSVEILCAAITIKKIIEVNVLVGNGALGPKIEAFVNVTYLNIIWQKLDPQKALVENQPRPSGGTSNRETKQKKIKNTLIP